MRRIVFGVFGFATAAIAAAQEAANAALPVDHSRIQDTAVSGISGIWVLANISYAGMRAQGSPSKIWRIVAFIFGFPGTLLSFLVIGNGECKAYGIHLPERRG